MDESTDNLIVEHLKGLRSEVQTLRSKMHSEFMDVKHRLASVETTIQRLERRLELSAGVTTSAIASTA